MPVSHNLECAQSGGQSNRVQSELNFSQVRAQAGSAALLFYHAAVDSKVLRLSSATHRLSSVAKEHYSPVQSRTPHS